MKKVKQFFLCALATFSITSVRAQVLDDSIVNQLKDGVRGFKDRYHSPSIVVVIVHDKDIIFSEASGALDLEKNIPATIDSKYPILSVTKVFTATMLMQLRQKNKLSLEDDVRKFLPEFRDANANKGNETTLFQLATHTSGLPRNSSADIDFTKQVDQWLLANAAVKTIDPATKKAFLQSLRWLRKEYPDYELLSYGDRHYSNLGYSMLGISLERAAKTDYSSYIIKNIFLPLGMTQSGFDNEKLTTNLAKGYYYNETQKNFIPTPVFKSNSALYAGGMYTTGRDLAKFISFQFDTSTRADRILSMKNRLMMYNFRIAWKPTFPFALHEGAMLGYRSVLVVNPDAKIGWLVLTNTTDFDFSRLNEYIHRLVTPVYSRKTNADLNKYVGTYELEGGYGSLKIYIKDGSLHSTYLDNLLSSTLLTPSGNDKFKGQGTGNYNINYEFLSNPAGEISILNMGQLMWIKK